MRVGALLLLPFSVGLLFGQGKQVGFVLASQGDWKWAANGNPKVQAGEPVLEHAMARATGKARLTVGMLDGTVKSFDCPANCVASIEGFRDASDPSLRSRLMAVGKTFFTQKETLPVYAMSRGASAAQFQPAVLPMKDGQVQLTGAVVRLDAGSYKIRLRQLRKNGATYNADLTWDPPNAVSVMVSGVSPGAYELTVDSSEGMRMGAASVVVATASAAPGLQRELDDARRLIAAWPPETDPAAVRNFWNALILDMAQRSQ